MRQVFVKLLIVLTLFFGLTYSQTRKQRIVDVRVQIELLLSKYANGPYKELGEIIDVDSSIGRSGVAVGNICDPYGTLKRCYLFMATLDGVQGEDQTHSIGIYKDKKIIWMSDQLPGSENYGYITDEGFLATKDLNRDGKTDVVVYFSDATNPPSGYFLWIFSWDGEQGKCINSCESDGATSICSTGAFAIDIDSHGTDEILSYDRDLKINGVYKWNGTLFSEQRGK